MDDRKDYILKDNGMNEKCRETFEWRYGDIEKNKGLLPLG